MTLRIVSGRAGTGKTTFIHKEIVNELKENPFGDPIYIIVPDQMSYSTEYNLTNKYGLNGIIRAQVVTFKRLAWYVLQETGGIVKDKMDTIGYRMLIRRLLLDNKEQFSLFKQAASQPGFAAEIEKIVKEFNQYNINSESLKETIQNLQSVQAPETLISKTKDIQIILEKLEEQLGQSYVDGEGYYPVLIEKIRQSEKLKNAHIYIDGFTAFTVREFDIVKQLLAHCKRMTVVLPFENEEDKNDEQAVFYRPALMNDKLIQQAKEFQIEIESRIHLTKTFRYNNEDLQHIEKHFHDPLPKPIECQQFVQIIEGANRRAEVHGIAREICRLVYEENVRYNEIGIMYRQADIYDPLINTIFSQYDIPVFTNEKKSMLHHPLIEFSRSVLEVVTSNWKYEPVFRSVKTDLFFPLGCDREEMRYKADKFENFVIAQGIYGNRWFDESRWFYKKYRGLEFFTNKQTDEELEMQQLLIEMRDLIREPLKKFQDQMRKAETGKEIATALYSFIEELNVYEKLQAQKDEEIKKSNFNRVSEQDQVWNRWINVLDQFVLMFGDQKLTLEEAASILDEGYDALHFSKIPPTLDEVTVGTFEYSRFDNKKVVFLIGVNDGVYPMRIDYEGLITDSERSFFEQVETEISPSSKQRLMQEAFLIYRALSSPTDRLYVTFSSSDEESKALIPSLYINKLHKLFEVDGKKTLPHHRIQIDPIDELNPSNAMNYIRHPRTAISYLIVQLKNAQKTKELPNEWRALQAFYEDHKKWKSIYESIKQPLEKKNEAQTLDKEIVDELYGNELLSSVSRVEKFFRCPFSHFASYGLRLEERAEFRLESFAIGDLFHEAFKWITVKTNEEKLYWNRLSFTDCQKLAKEAVEQIVPVFSSQILLSTARYRYIQRKLIKIIERTLYALAQHARVSQFKPIAIEASFGPNKDDQLPPLKIPLTNGKKMTLRGRIDRVDSAIIGNKPYIRIIDYKSSQRDLDLNEVFYGISLQLLTYLDVVVENSKILLGQEASPAGVLYVHVHNPILKVDEPLSETQIETMRLKEYRMKGLLANDSELIIGMDEEIENDGSSKVIPAYYSKKEKKVSTALSRVIEPEAMKELSQFVRKKHQQAGKKIISGETSIMPYRLKDQIACKFCNFKSICQFDATEQRYHLLQADSSDNILEKIREELKQNETIDSN